MRLDSVSPYQTLKKRVIEEQQTECNREQIEKAIIPRHADRELQRNEKTSRDMPQPPRRPDKKRPDDLDDETKRDRKFLEPFRVLVRPPADHSRQRLGPIVVIERGDIPP